mmetsp:Transcript_54077/g.63191  ORF Transcript_54077/g.63191 Transcript_54077/m.63191 type:complete len:1050 (+) Transcript_54077:398-3547(+)
MMKRGAGGISDVLSDATMKDIPKPASLEEYEFLLTEATQTWMKTAQRADAILMYASYCLIALFCIGAYLYIQGSFNDAAGFAKGREVYDDDDVDDGIINEDELVKVTRNRSRNSFRRLPSNTNIESENANGVRRISSREFVPVEKLQQQITPHMRNMNVEQDKNRSEIDDIGWDYDNDANALLGGVVGDIGPNGEIITRPRAPQGAGNNLVQQAQQEKHPNSTIFRGIEHCDSNISGDGNFELNTIVRAKSNTINNTASNTRRKHIRIPTSGSSESGAAMIGLLDDMSVSYRQRRSTILHRDAGVNDNDAGSVVSALSVQSNVSSFLRHPLGKNQQQSYNQSTQQCSTNRKGGASTPTQQYCDHEDYFCNGLVPKSSIALNGLLRPQGGCLRSTTNSSSVCMTDASPDHAAGRSIKQEKRNSNSNKPPTRGRSKDARGSRIKNNQINNRNLRPSAVPFIVTAHSPTPKSPSALGTHQQEDLETALEEVETLRIENATLKEESVRLTKESLTWKDRYEALLDNPHAEAQAKWNYDEAHFQLEVLEGEHEATKNLLNAVMKELSHVKTVQEGRICAMENDQKQQVQDLKDEIRIVRTRAEQVGANTNVSIEDEAVLRIKIENIEERLTIVTNEFSESETTRKAIHNQLLEMKGNIRVFVRIRPFLDHDSKADGSKSLDSAVDWHPDGKTLSISGGNELLTSPGPSGKGLDFTFDKVFTPTATQEIVFDEVSDFVQSALDGYKVCLFSYGQTGSGKTFTMQGKGKEDFRGIIPRAVELVLQRLKVLQNSNWEFTINASFLEIYNEELRDLLTILAPPSKAGGKRRLSMGKKSAPKLAIKKSENGRTYVEGLTEILIDSHNTTKGLKQLDKVITAAARARSVAFNKLNSESSRSHSIFMLDLHGINHDLDEEVQGVLNLCDLAGSERLSRSGYGANDSQRVKETQAINKSLSSLGDVFTSLSNGSPHVPYRNSKLTYLLQDCLNGNGKSLMLMNLCPTVESAHESACSLRFARRVNQVELGKAVKQVNTSSSYCGGSVSGGRSIGGRSVGSRR